MDERWEKLTDDIKSRLEESARTFEFAKGTRLYTQGQTPPEWLYRVERGEVELRLRIDFEESVIGYKRPGDLLGWFVVLADKPNPFSAVSAVDITVRAYPKKILHEAFLTNASFAGAVARAMDDNIFLIHRHLEAELRVRAIDRVETFPFRKRISEIMNSPVIGCDPDTTILEAARIMRDKKVRSLVVTGGDGKALGIVTQTDFIGTIIKNEDWVKEPVSQIMNSQIKGIRSDLYVYQAIGMMQRENIKHLPVIEGKRAIGMITMRELIRLRSHGTLELISQVEQKRDPRQIGQLRDSVIPVIRSMLEESIPSLEISGLISHINEEIHRRAIELTIEEMGQPPVDFCFFVVGSHGRKENHLVTDQDHGMITEPYPPGRHNEIEDYLVPFSERICDLLALAGLPYCDGSVMIRNPVWRKTLPEWKSQIDIWMRGTDKIKVRYLTLLADMAPIYGNKAYALELKIEFFKRISQNANVLRGLYEEASEHKAPLGVFKRIITESGEEHEGQIDLKKSGIIFMVEALRILAIKNGIEAVNSMDRLKELTDSGVISKEDEEFLSSSYSRLFDFLLRNQIKSVAKGEKPDTYLQVDVLSEWQSELLVGALKSVKRMQSILHSEFGNIFF